MDDRLPIPERGLAEVLTGWSGRGQLFEALACASSLDDRAWTSRDVERRAHRILFQLLLPAVVRLPTSVSTWFHALPAESLKSTYEGPSPSAGTSWPATRARGWPPRIFIARARHRTPDTALVSWLRWTLDRLLDITSDALSVEPTLGFTVERQLDAVAAVLEGEPLRSALAVEPAKNDITALRHEGRPWTAVALLATRLRALDHASLRELSSIALMPDEELRWRLFHLAILGELLAVLRGLGAQIRWLRPLSSSSAGGPTYEVTLNGKSWDLWFEAGGAWKHYGKVSPYAQVASVVPGAGRSLGSDLMMVRPGATALIIECKYSAHPSVIGRVGYEQTLSYVTEAVTAFAVDVTGVVVGAGRTVRSLALGQTHSGRIGFCDVESLDRLVVDVMGRTTSA